MKRVKAVSDFRAASKSEGTRKLADAPLRFHVENIPTDTFIVIPKVSSEKRRYIPIGFMGADTLASDLVFVMPNATLYHFGILTSNVHNAWVRAVCGRLEMRYRYSKDIVYNNFPWCDATGAQRSEIEALAQSILGARANYPGSSLADMYGETSMMLFPDLLKAHKALDRAVLKLYGLSGVKDEAGAVARLMERYRAMADKGAKL
jgi:hypothetical protein